MSAGLSTVCFLNTSEYCPIPVRKLLSKRQKITKVGEDVEKREPSGTAGGMYCGAAAMETVWRFRKKLKPELPYDPAIPCLSIHPEKLKH